MSDSVAREWRFYIDDTITSAEKVIANSGRFDQTRFVANNLHRVPHLTAIRCQSEGLTSTLLSRASRGEPVPLGLADEPVMALLQRLGQQGDGRPALKRARHRAAA